MRLLIAAAVLLGVSMVPHAAVAGEPQSAPPQARPRAQAPLFPALPPAVPLAPLPAPAPKFAVPPQFLPPLQSAPTLVSPVVPTRMVCGMTVVEGDAKIDPQMVQHVGTGGGLLDSKPIITVVQPSICGR